MRFKPGLQFDLLGVNISEQCKGIAELNMTRTSLSQYSVLAEKQQHKSCPKNPENDKAGSWEDGEKGRWRPGAKHLINQSAGFGVVTLKSCLQ